jgi:hypothetical protein
MANAGLHTLAYLKSRLLPASAVTQTEWDTDLTAVGKAVAGAFDRHCGRRFARGAGITFTAGAEARSFVLPAYPVESVSAAALLTGESSLDILANITGVFKPSGIVDFGDIVGAYNDQVTITYTGGYWTQADGGTQPSGSTALPDDILEAWVAQCMQIVRELFTFEEKAVRRFSEKSPPSAPNIKLEDGVREILKPYLRYA